MNSSPISDSNVNNLQTPIQQFPPWQKGGQGGFTAANKSKAPSIPLFQRGKQFSSPPTKNLVRLIALLLNLLAAPTLLQAQSLPAVEKQKIEALIKHVGDLKDAKFVRNGSTYEPSTAVRFLRGKWDANKTEVKSARDFIDKVASMSGTSGKPYLIRFNDGREIKSREFLLAELKRFES